MPDSETTGVPAGEADAGSVREPVRERPSTIDALADLLQLVVDFLRQETEGIVREKIVLPTQKAGQVVAFALAAAGVLVLGTSFIAVAALLVLAGWLGWPLALFAIGAVLVIGAAALTVAKMRSLQ